jgi:hypothetical protein
VLCVLVFSACECAQCTGNLLMCPVDCQCLFSIID